MERLEEQNTDEQTVLTISLDSLMQKNKRLHNTHAGERCFILGNGPSLRKIDLSILQNEFVFTVNFFTNADGWEKVKSNAHVWADPASWDLSNKSNINLQNVIDVYHKMASQHAIMFARLEAIPFIKTFRLDEIIDIYYLFAA